MCEDSCFSLFQIRCSCEHKAQDVDRDSRCSSVNQTMRLHKILFLVFLVLYFIAGLSLLITGSVAHRQAAQCKSPDSSLVVLHRSISPRCGNYGSLANVGCWLYHCSRRNHHRSLRLGFHRCLQESSESLTSFYRLTSFNLNIAIDRGDRRLYPSQQSG